MNTRNKLLPHASLEVNTDTAIVLTDYRLIDGILIYTIRKSDGSVADVTYEELCIIESLSDKPTIMETTFIAARGG